MRRRRQLPKSVIHSKFDSCSPPVHINHKLYTENTNMTQANSMAKLLIDINCTKAFVFQTISPCGIFHQLIVEFSLRCIEIDFVRMDEGKSSEKRKLNLWIFVCEKCFVSNNIYI